MYKVKTAGPPCQTIATKLRPEQESLGERVKIISKHLVEPLRNILQGEITHAMDCRQRYAKQKRLFDECATSIKKLQQQMAGKRKQTWHK